MKAHVSIELSRFEGPAIFPDSTLPMYHLSCALQKYPVLSHKIIIITTRNNTDRQTVQTNSQTPIQLFLFVVTCTRRTLGTTHLCNVRVHARIINIYLFTITYYSLVFIIVSKLVAAIWYAQQLN